MILVDNTYAAIIREQDIMISPSDLNVLLSTIRSHPAVKKTTTILPICLPGISDEGFIYLTIKYTSQAIGIIFASLSRDNFSDCKEAVNQIDLDMQHEEISKSLVKCMETFYTAPYSKGKLHAFITRNKRSSSGEE